MKDLIIYILFFGCFGALSFSVIDLARKQLIMFRNYQLATWLHQECIPAEFWWRVHSVNRVADEEWDIFLQVEGSTLDVCNFIRFRLVGVKHYKHIFRESENPLLVSFHPGGYIKNCLA